ncbi:MAG: DUF5683 domain-containing protein [Candidatus Neomarinimicrobiota bacterium]|nr:DUF5683 domain-containing protein [Candidatus Neomarinimicrobiota bacterium]
MIKILIMILAVQFVSANDLYNLDNRFHSSYYFFQDSLIDDSINQILRDDTLIVYPARPMLYSLIFPGLGQWYNKSPLWKISLFSGIEIASIASAVQWMNKADDIRVNYELFADDNWDLETWVYNTLSTPIGNYADVHIDGTHKLTLILSGALAEQFGTFVTSDSLEDNAHWVYSGEVAVLRDRDFYENIGKYDQFVGGWTDCYDQTNNQLWFEVYKDVGDSVETIITTPNKEDYVSQRAKSNDYLNMAKFAISAMMFNHVVSAMDAIWSTQNKNRPKKSKELKTDVGLLYDRNSKYGVGGLSISLYW